LYCLVDVSQWQPERHSLQLRSQYRLIFPSTKGASIMVTEIVRANITDIPFLKRGYINAQQSGATVKAVPLETHLRRGIEVGDGSRKPEPGIHPFVYDPDDRAAPVITFPIDSVNIVKDGDIDVGFLWLRDYKDEELAPETYGEIILVWIDPSFRKRGYWPVMDAFAREWASRLKKTFLIARCLKPSRRMAEVLAKSEYQLFGQSESGMTVHVWRP
jgi:hypothetical protein